MDVPNLSAAFTRTVQLRHLRCFVAIAQERHLARAATRLSITQPAVSKTLGELEALTQSQLILRTTEGRRGMLGLTEAGERLLPHSIAVLDAVGAGGASLAEVPEGASESLRLGVLTCLSSGALPKALARLVADRPALHVSVETASNPQLTERLRAGTLDMVLGRMSDPKLLAGLSFELLSMETLAFAVRRGHPLGTKPPPLQSVLTHTLVAHPKGTVPRQCLDTLLASRALKPPVRMVETSNFTLARGLVMESDAVWIVPRFSVMDDVNGGLLTALPIDAAGTEDPVGLYRNVGKAFTSAAMELARLLRTYYEPAPLR